MKKAAMKKPNTMKLALGTVQFGLDYGISNDGGKVPIDEVKKILTTAHQNQIDTLDTGCVYGTCETVLGDVLPGQDFTFNVIDKIPDIETVGKAIAQTLEQSLAKLHLSHLEGLLLHNAADLTDATYQQLSDLKTQGLVKKIGVSVYHPAQAFELAKRYDLDLIQLPLNLCDQRFIQTGCIKWLKKRNVEIHARSLFLQGLLLMKTTQLSSYFAPYRELFDRLDRYCRELEITRQQAALTIAHQQDSVDKFVIGVCSQQQLEQVIGAYQKAQNIEFKMEPFSCHEEALISPFLWPQKSNS
jgi:aryl-alcohol dehydrogenase-like predicted oxidoreductase